MRFLNIKRILIIVFFLLILSSCDAFLSETSQDKFVPKTLSDYREWLAGDGLAVQNPLSLGEYLELMTDDLADNFKNKKNIVDNRIAYYGFYSWDKDPYYSGKTLERVSDIDWPTYYKRIWLSNFVLNAVPKLEGNEAEKYDLLGEAHFIRAWSYFNLVNTYADPYESREQAKKTKAIPINPYVDVIARQLPIANLAEVYDLIISDLNRAVENFSKSNLKKSNLRPNLTAAHLLLARCYLYVQNWDKVIEHSNKVIENKAYSLLKLEKGKVEKRNDFVLMNATNSEIIFTYNKNDINAPKKVAANNTSYKTSNDLMTLYVKDDLRKDAFFNVASGLYKPTKFYFSSKGVLGYAFRLSEAYLNRAEAYCKKGDIAKSLADINLIRENRFASPSPLNVTTAAELLQKVKDERRRELCFEGHRWFDLRRWGRPEIRHVYSAASESNAETFILKEKDPRYTLPYPKSEIENTK